MQSFLCCVVIWTSPSSSPSAFWFKNFHPLSSQFVTTIHSNSHLCFRNHPFSQLYVLSSSSQLSSIHSLFFSSFKSSVQKKDIKLGCPLQTVPSLVPRVTLCIGIVAFWLPAPGGNPSSLSWDIASPCKIWSASNGYVSALSSWVHLLFSISMVLFLTAFSLPLLRLIPYLFLPTPPSLLLSQSY